MAKYYAMVSGLPNLGIEDRKLPFSSASFVKELDDVLTTRDKHLLDLLRFEKDNKFVINFLLDPSHTKDSANHSILIDIEELECVLRAMKNGQKLPKNHLPSYLIDFLYDTQIEKSDDDRELSINVFYDEEERRISYPIHLEDKLAEYYYKYTTNCENEFVEDWAQFNLNIKNVFVAHIARDLNWNPADYIVGDGKIERKLKESIATNFSLNDDDMAYLPQILTIINEKDITRRERMLDLLRWNWLEDRVFDRPFDIEAILCYYLQLTIVERWTDLNDKIGEETFRKIVSNLKKESNTSLEQFKRNQKK